MDCYRAAMKHFSPLWHEPFAEITVDDLQECMDETIGKRTQQNMKALCGLIYKYAIPRNLATLNMGQYLVVNGEGGIGKEGLPLDALEKLKKNVGKVPYVDYIVAQCYLGFRPSELLELDASNYDRKNKAFTGGAKTEAGRNRIVTVSPKIQATVDRLTERKLSGPVFCAPDGTPLSIEEYRQEFYKALEACGIDNPIITVNGVNRRTYTPPQLPTHLLHTDEECSGSGQGQAGSDWPYQHRDAAALSGCGFGGSAAHHKRHLAVNSTLIIPLHFSQFYTFQKNKKVPQLTPFQG